MAERNAGRTTKYREMSKAELETQQGELALRRGRARRLSGPRQRLQERTGTRLQQ